MRKGATEAGNLVIGRNKISRKKLSIAVGALRAVSQFVVCEFLTYARLKENRRQFGVMKENRRQFGVMKEYSE